MSKRQTFIPMHRTRFVQMYPTDNNYSTLENKPKYPIETMEEYIEIQTDILKTMFKSMKCDPDEANLCIDQFRTTLKSANFQ